MKIEEYQKRYENLRSKHNFFKSRMSYKYFIMSIFNEHFQVFDILLAYNPNTKAINDRGKVAIHIAAE